MTEIQVESLNIPIFTDVVQEVQSWVERAKEPFMWDRSKFRAKKYELTAVFSRDKEYL